MRKLGLSRKHSYILIVLAFQGCIFNPETNKNVSPLVSFRAEPTAACSNNALTERLDCGLYVTNRNARPGKFKIMVENIEIDTLLEPDSTFITYFNGAVDQKIYNGDSTNWHYPKVYVIENQDTTSFYIKDSLANAEYFMPSYFKIMLYKESQRLGELPLSADTAITYSIIGDSVGSRKIECGNFFPKSDTIRYHPKYISIDIKNSYNEIDNRVSLFNVVSSSYDDMIFDYSSYHKSKSYPGEAFPSDQGRVYFLDSHKYLFDSLASDTTRVVFYFGDTPFQIMILPDQDPK